MSVAESSLVNHVFVEDVDTFVQMVGMKFFQPIILSLSKHI